jgi:transposase
MLADQLDYIVGVDPHCDSHALAVVEVVSAAVVFEATVDANSAGYALALRLVNEHAAGRCAFAVEGTGSFGAGLRRFLAEQGQWVLELGRLRRERRSGGKTDALDAVPAARSALAQQRPGTPRAGGERQALQALVAAREGALKAKRAGLCQLRGPADHNPRSRCAASCGRSHGHGCCNASQQHEHMAETTPSFAAAWWRCARSRGAYCS